jgi:hypothetical protein
MIFTATCEAGDLAMADVATEDRAPKFQKKNASTAALANKAGAAAPQPSSSLRMPRSFFTQHLALKATGGSLVYAY